MVTVDLNAEDAKVFAMDAEKCFPLRTSAKDLRVLCV
jgi:hypothetical protein